MIINRQRGVRVPVRELDKFLSLALRHLRVSPQSLSVCLVENAEIARWNRSYRGKKGPTDVLSFPTYGARGRKHKQARNLRSRERFFSAGFLSSTSAASYMGDIAIAPAVARRNARRFGRTFPDEMRILILHGILHLMGYDHETDDGEMDRREHRLRRELRLA
ncbi:MAG: rRNA maturation RNase YbeY [Candidatus Acidiferrales bacterium]